MSRTIRKTVVLTLASLLAAAPLAAAPAQGPEVPPLWGYVETLWSWLEEAVSGGSTTGPAWQPKESTLTTDPGTDSTQDTSLGLEPESTSTSTSECTEECDDSEFSTVPDPGG